MAGQFSQDQLTQMAAMMAAAFQAAGIGPGQQQPAPAPVVSVDGKTAGRQFSHLVGLIPD